MNYKYLLPNNYFVRNAFLGSILKIIQCIIWIFCLAKEMIASHEMAEFYYYDLECKQRSIFLFQSSKMFVKLCRKTRTIFVLKIEYFNYLCMTLHTPVIVGSDVGSDVVRPLNMAVASELHCGMLFSVIIRTTMTTLLDGGVSPEVTTSSFCTTRILRPELMSVTIAP